MDLDGHYVRDAEARKNQLLEKRVGEVRAFSSKHSLKPYHGVRNPNSHFFRIQDETQFCRL